MLPSFVSNFFWGQSAAGAETNQNEEQEKLATVIEGHDDWLIVDCTGNPLNDRTLTVLITAGVEDDNESLTSESSWVMAPSPRFLKPSTDTTVSHHSLENLLLDNPTMSFYNKCSTTHDEVCNELKNKQLVPYDKTKKQVVLHSNENKKLVLYNLQAKQELAKKLGIPLVISKNEQRPSVEPISQAIPKTNKKSLNKHNKNMIRVTRGKKTYKIHSCGIKAGRRRS